MTGANTQDLNLVLTTVAGRQVTGSNVAIAESRSMRILNIVLIAVNESDRCGVRGAGYAVRVTGCAIRGCGVRVTRYVF